LESGSTTTPFDLHVRNKTDRYTLLIEALEKLVDNGAVDESKATRVIEIYKQKTKDHLDYIKQNGIDPLEIENWKWTKNI